MVGELCTFAIIVILSIAIGRIVAYIIVHLIFHKEEIEEKEKNLKEIITENFGCTYCKNFYYNNDGSGGCLRDIRHPIYEICFKPDIKKIEEVLADEDCCDGTSPGKN
jgi:hypothetical protein